MAGDQTGLIGTVWAATQLAPVRWESVRPTTRAARSFDAQGGYHGSRHGLAARLRSRGKLEPAARRAKRRSDRRRDRRSRRHRGDGDRLEGERPAPRFAVLHSWTSY